MKNYIKEYIKKQIFKIFPHSIINRFEIYLRAQFDFESLQFGYLGKNVRLVAPIHFFAPESVYLYDNTSIRGNSIFIMRPGYGRFIMKERSGAAEGLTVVTNNHTINPIIGKFHREHRNEKLNEIDKDIIVEEDVWLASNVTLLAGVKIGRGSVIGAGAVCRYSVPPYSIVIGNPAKVIGFVLTPQEILEHEKILYPEEERLPLEKLEKNYNKYYLKKIKEIAKFVKL